MRLYGSETPKRHLAYCNSAAIALLDLGRLEGWCKKVQQQDQSGVSRKKTVQKYVDKNGRERYKGTVHLKGTESETYLLETLTYFQYQKN